MLDAGSVVTTLTGRFSPAAFAKFDAAIKTSARAMETAEAKMAASSARLSKAVTTSTTEQSAARRRAAVVADGAAQAQIAADRATIASTNLVRDANGRLRDEKGKFVRDADRVVSANGRVAASHRSTASSSEAAGRAYRVAGVGVLAAGYAIYKSIGIAADYEQQLDAVAAVTRATTREQRALRQATMDAGAATKFSALEAAQAAEALGKGGLTVKQIVGGGLNAALALASAGELDLADAAEVTVNAMKQFGLHGRDAGHIADALATAANTTTSDVSDLALALRQGGGVAAMAGANFDETVAAISALSDASVRGSDAGTSLKSFFLNIATPSRVAAKAMRDLGMDIFTTGGNLKSMPAIAANLRDAFGDLTKEEFLNRAGIIAGSDAARALFAIYKAGPQGMRQYLAAQRESGTAAELAAKKQDNLRGRLEQLGGSLQTAQIAIGSELLPLLREWATEGTEAVNAWVDSGGAQQFGEGVVSTLREVVDIGGDVVHVLGEVGGALHLDDLDTLLALAAGFGAFKAATTVLPMVATGVSGLAAALGVLTEASVALRIAGPVSAVGVIGNAALASINPVTALATVLAAAAAAYVYFKSGEQSAADAAEATTGALKDQAAAVQALQDAILSTADATFAARHAEQDLAEAKRHTSDVAREYGRHSKQYRDALDAENEVALRATAAQKRLNDEKRRTREETERTIAAGRKAVEKARGELEKKFADIMLGGGSKAEKTREMSAAFEVYADRLDKVARNSAQARIAQLDLQRVLNGGRLISDRYAESVAKLGDVYKAMPRSQQVRLATTAQPALVQIGNLVGALRDVPRQQVVNILARADSAKSQIAGLQAVVDGVPTRRVIQILSTANTERVKIAALNATIAGMPRRAVSQILANGALSERAKVTAFTAAVRGVPARKIAQILANGALSGKQQVDALRASIDALHDKSVTTTVVARTINETVNRSGGFRGFASGRGAGRGEDAVVGEGSRWQGAREAIVDRSTGTGFIVDRPTAMRLSDDQYVIPLDEHRSAAMGLMAALARDMGLTGYARGRRARGRGGRRAHRHHQIPGKLDPLSLPVGDLETKVSNARSRLESDRSTIESLPGQISSTQASIRDIERREAGDARSKANKADDLARAKKKLHQQQAELARAKRDANREKVALSNLQRELRTAKAYQARIDRQADLANLARQDMDLADRRGDDAAFGVAQGRRTAALRELQRLLGAAQRHVKVDSAYFRELAGQIKQAQIDAFDTAAEGGDGGDGEAMTDAERDRLSRINADIALAGLTEGLDDDRAAGQSLVDFLSSVLSEVQADPAHRGGNEAIADIAGQLKTAKDNLRSLTTSTTPDMQAQLDQANAKTADAETRARIAEQYAAVAGGPGDIGSGGPSAYGAAGGGVVIHQTNQMMHPADSSVLRTLAATTVAGFDLQGVRRTPRGSVGP